MTTTMTATTTLTRRTWTQSPTISHHLYSHRHLHLITTKTAAAVLFTYYLFLFSFSHTFSPTCVFTTTMKGFHHHQPPSPPVFTITTLVFMRFHVSYLSFSLIHHLFTNIVLDTLVNYHLVSRVCAALARFYHHHPCFHAFSHKLIIFFTDSSVY